MSVGKGYEGFRGRLSIEGTLTLHSPMHIGSGFADGLYKENEDSAESIEIGGIILGHDGKPVIPSTSLKGALRARLEQAGVSEDVVNTLFGTIKDSNKDKDQSGCQGCLVPMAATCASLSATLEQAVGWEKDISKGTFLAQRTAIDGASGVPEGSKLFAQNVVAPGATFKFRLVLMRDPEPTEAPEEAHTTALKQLVGTLCHEGIYLGSGKGDGHGLLKLTLEKASGIRIEKQTIKPVDGAKWLNALKAANALPATFKRYKLSLSTDDPFFVLGSQKKEGAAQGDNNKLKAVRLKKDTPELPATSLMGALRASAEWFEALHAMREGARLGDIKVDERKVLLAELFGVEADDLKGMRAELASKINARRSDKAQRDRKPIRTSQISGFAGMLKVLSIKPAVTPVRTIPSVKIDRFTQGPMDKALFETEAFVGPKFDVELALDHRARDEHYMFIETFLAHISSESVNAGLMLGHATNRGYGWFKVAFTPLAAPATKLG